MYKRGKDIDLEHVILKRIFSFLLVFILFCCLINDLDFSTTMTIVVQKSL